MNVLIAHAVGQGLTVAVAREIGSVLTRDGVTTTVLPVEHVGSVDEFDAVVLGSAVHYGHWLPDATRFVDLHQKALRARPVWLFSTGPIGQDPQPKHDSAAISEKLRKTRARDHSMFSGSRQRQGLHLIEDLVVRIVHHDEGDPGDWDDVRGWAKEIAAALQPPAEHSS